MFNKINLILAVLVCNFMSIFADPNFIFDTEKSNDGVYLSAEGYYPENFRRDPVLKNIEKVVQGNIITVLYLQNFPKNKEIILSMSEPRHIINENEELFKESRKFTVTDDNLLKINQVKTDFLWFASFGSPPGARVQFKFKAVDGSFEYTTFFMPHPIFVPGENSIISLQAELLTLIPITVYEFYLAGVDKDEVVRLRSTSGDERINDAFVYGEKSRFVFIPGVEGKEGGYAQVTISTDKDKVTFKLPWGSELLKYFDKQTFHPIKPIKSSCHPDFLKISIDGVVK